MRTRTAAGAVLFAASLALSPASRADEAADVVAAQIRLQGLRCDKPVRATRDIENSRPDAAAWLLECRNAVYRVQLIPHRAARVELLEPREGPR